MDSHEHHEPAQGGTAPWGEGGLASPPGKTTENPAKHACAYGPPRQELASAGQDPVGRQSKSHAAQVILSDDLR